MRDSLVWNSTLPGLRTCSSSTATARSRRAGWTRPRETLERRPDVAVVLGRRRERYPDRTIYNRLADLEWDIPIGEVKACGGDAMIRVEAFRRVDGYNPSIIAAEDDELCLRIRGQGWKVLRIDAEMTLHDMAMTRFAQWWSRADAMRARLRRRSGAVRPNSRASLCPPGTKHVYLGVVAAVRRAGPGLADPRCKPRATGRVCDPLVADRAVLPAEPGLAGGRRPGVRRVLRAGEVSARGRHAKVWSRRMRRQAGPDHRVPRDRSRGGRRARRAQSEHL